MQRTNIFILFVLVIVCASCDVNISSENAFTATPDFVTATLPPSLISPATQITTIPASTLSIVAEPTITPVEGTTTTQVNVRAETSTASETLGLVGQFAKVQVIGRDASGSWYRIVFAESATGYGWVRAEYVQVNAPEEIPLVEIVAGSGSGVSGLVIQKINVRNGPGTNFDSLGVLSPNDVVAITGKDPSGAWIQIIFTNSPDGKGWAASEFLKVDNLDSLPVIGNVGQTVSPTNEASIPTVAVLTAREDGDSIQAPSVSVNLSALGERTLQFSGDVSSPNGDMEDWVQFTSFTTNILVEVKCSNNALRVELSNNDLDAIKTILTCGIKSAIKIMPNQPYLFRIQANSSNNFEYIQYSLKISAIE